MRIITVINENYPVFDGVTIHPHGSNDFGGTMRVTATKFKQNIDRILDSVLANGKPVEVERKGQIIRLVPVYTVRKKSKLMNLEPHDAIVGDPESIVDIDWSKEWL